MADLNANQLLVAVKAYARGNNIPLDSSSVYGSEDAALTYAQTSPVAYAGQIIALENGRTFTLVVDGVTEVSPGVTARFKLNELATSTAASAATEWETLG